MMMDKQLMFSEAQDLSQAAGTYNSTNVIDLGASGVTGAGATVAGNAGLGRKIEVVALVTEAFTSGGAATVDVRLVESASSDLSSPTTLSSTGALAMATLIAGYRPKLGFELPPVTKRYIGLQYVIATATTTAGAITAGLVLDRQTNGLIA